MITKKISKDVWDRLRDRLRKEGRLTLENVRGVNDRYPSHTWVVIDGVYVSYFNWFQQKTTGGAITDWVIAFQSAEQVEMMERIFEELNGDLENK